MGGGGGGECNFVLGLEYSQPYQQRVYLTETEVPNGELWGARLIVCFF